MFGDVGSGIKHFSDITGAKADKLPSLQEIEENKKEVEALPPPDLTQHIYTVGIPSLKVKADVGGFSST